MRGALGAAISLAVVLVLSAGGAANAETIFKDTGNHGAVHFFDSDGFPGAMCGYSQPVGGYAYLRWLKTFGPSVQAYDRRPATPDHQEVVFQVQVLHEIGMNAWKVVGSASQSKTAYDDTWTNFGTLKVAVNGTRPDEAYRVVASVKWLRNGNVDGLVKAEIDYYSVKWTVGDPSYQFTGSCPGRAD